MLVFLAVALLLIRIIKGPSRRGDQRAGDRSTTIVMYRSSNDLASLDRDLAELHARARGDPDVRDLLSLERRSDDRDRVAPRPKIFLDECAVRRAHGFG